MAGCALKLSGTAFSRGTPGRHVQWQTRNCQPHRVNAGFSICSRVVRVWPHIAVSPARPLRGGYGSQQICHTSVASHLRCTINDAMLTIHTADPSILVKNRLPCVWLRCRSSSSWRLLRAQLASVLPVCERVARQTHTAAKRSMAAEAVPKQRVNRRIAILGFRGVGAFVAELRARAAVHSPRRRCREVFTHQASCRRRIL